VNYPKENVKALLPIEEHFENQPSKALSIEGSAGEAGKGNTNTENKRKTFR